MIELRKKIGGSPRTLLILSQKPSVQTLFRDLRLIMTTFLKTASEKDRTSVHTCFQRQNHAQIIYPEVKLKDGVFQQVIKNIVCRFSPM